MRPGDRLTGPKERGGGPRPNLAGWAGGLGAASRSAEREALARLRRFGGDRLVRDMAELYLGQMPERLAAARAAADRRDPGAFAGAAHAMRSSSAQLGAAALTDVLERAEQAGNGGDIVRSVGLLVAIEREYASFSAWLATVTGLDSELPDGEPPPPDSAGP